MTVLTTDYGAFEVDANGSISEFSFVAKFQVNHPPMTYDNHFIEDQLKVWMRPDANAKKWQITSIQLGEQHNGRWYPSDDSTDTMPSIPLHADTTQALLLQGRFRASMGLRRVADGES